MSRSFGSARGVARGSRALANQHERFGLAQSLGERVDVLDVIVPDLDIVPDSFAKQSSVRSVSW
jgi:hypothetical protein